MHDPLGEAMVYETRWTSAPIRVVLGDESETSLMLLAAMLDDDPRFAIASRASTGTQVYADSEQADLVVLDLFLADGDALEVISRMRDRDPSLPIVVFAAVDPPYLRAEAEAHGAVAFFRRGLDPQTVLDGFADAARLAKAD